MPDQVAFNDAQAQKFQELNDAYGVAKWTPVPNEPNAVLLTMDDGDRCILYTDGTVIWDFTGK